MSNPTPILNMSKIYDRTISQSAIMLFMIHQGPLEAPRKACFIPKFPRDFILCKMLLDIGIIKEYQAEYDILWEHNQLTLTQTTY